MMSIFYWGGPIVVKINYLSKISIGFGLYITALKEENLKFMGDIVVVQAL